MSVHYCLLPIKSVPENWIKSNWIANFYSNINQISIIY